MNIMIFWFQRTSNKAQQDRVHFGNTQVSILFYADDIFLIADDEQSLQDQLNYLYEWCNKWRLSLNNSKN